MKIRPEGADLLHAMRRTSMAKLIVALRSFTNALKKALSLKKFSVPYNSYRLLDVFKKCSWNLSKTSNIIRRFTILLLLKINFTIIIPVTHNFRRVTFLQTYRALCQNAREKWVLFMDSVLPAL